MKQRNQQRREEAIPWRSELKRMAQKGQERMASPSHQERREYELELRLERFDSQQTKEGRKGDK
jgi:hypothetical protein